MSNKNSNTSLYKQSEEHVKAVQERKRSSAAGYHDERVNRERTRSDSKREAINEQYE